MRIQEIDDVFTNFPLSLLVWGTQVIETLIRKLPVQFRIKFDSVVKDFISEVLLLRKQMYQTRLLPWGKTIWKESDSGTGKNSFLFKYLTGEKRYRVQVQQGKIMQEYKKLKLETS